MSAESETTPLMKQYRSLKAQAGDALLLFRMGDFYELFGEDAVTAARVLEITLTSRDKNKPNPVPMAGVPHHSAQAYIQKLLKSGFKVAIGEQMEDPAQVTGKAIVRRELVRTFTPAVQFDGEGSEACYLAAWVPGEFSGQAVLALLDVSTGEALVSDSLSHDEAISEIAELPVRHLLTLGGPEIPARAGLLVESLPENYLSLEQGRELLGRQYTVADLAPFLGSDPQTARALGVAVAYALKTQGQNRLDHLRLPAPLKKPKTLVLGPRTPQHLDLVPETPSQTTPTLFGLVNRTKSALGARMLRRWMLAPLKDVGEIHARQEAVRELQAPMERSRALRALLATIYDLERICGRLNARLANPRDTLAMGKSLVALGRCLSLLGEPRGARLKDLARALTEVTRDLIPLGERIVREQRDDAPLVSREGGIFNTGVASELDRLLKLTADGEQWLLELEARERETTGIPNLKIRYNRVFGYYMEVTQAHLKNVPDRYQRKQTTMGSERFFTEELKKFEEEILTAGSRQKSFEQDLFEKRLEELRGRSGAIMAAAQGLAELDAFLSLADLADESGWVLPAIDDSLELEIRAGRHPMVDAGTGGRFVPNDVTLDGKTHPVLVITGPNMGGKSTVMRQTALIVILGQMGAPVPAAEARWGSFSSLYTRIGAHDAIARGQSTFMVEMSELAHILHRADERALVVLDEIGRGTSTYDGVSVAWASLEWICNHVKARTLFATHYHELTELAKELPEIRNAHLEVSQAGGKLRFLYQLKDGPASESFGIHVARMAGLPKPVIDRAWKVLEKLEREQDLGSGTSPDQLSLFSRAAEPEAPVLPGLLSSLDTLDLHQMTPIQALNELARLKSDYLSMQKTTPSTS
jgi:DNA mismatch repair protein MutS